MQHTQTFLALWDEMHWHQTNRVSALEKLQA